MLVFWKEKLVILSVPKTGTTALHAAYSDRADIVVRNPPELKHAPLYRYNRFFRPMFERACKEENMETLAVMREPISWLGSWWRYRQREFLDGKPTSTKGISFDEFVDAYTRGDKPTYANVGSQAKFLEKRPNGTEVNHLYRYEDQEGLMAFLEQRLGSRPDLPRLNISTSTELRLSPNVETKLRRKCFEEFELYASI